MDKKRKRKRKWEKRKSERRLRERMKSGVAQWKRGRPITCRSVDRNFPPAVFSSREESSQGKGSEWRGREEKDVRRGESQERKRAA